VSVVELADGAPVEARVLALAAAVERGSEHPLGAAIIAEARARALSIPASTAFDAVPGQGVRAIVEGREVRVGRAEFVEAAGPGHGAGSNAGARSDPGEGPAEAADFGLEAATLAADGKSVVFLGIDRRRVAMVAIADALKPGARTAVAALRQGGRDVVLLTGDDQRTAEAIARQAGIERVLADVRPDGKAAAIRDLQAGGRGVAMVGDGVNDAPALAAADVGIAMGTGTDAAIESAGVTLLSGDLRGLVAAIGLSRATMRNIRQNLFWAFAYNVILIPVAMGALFPLAGVLLDPVLAAAAMALSSVTVVSNALRLRGYQPAPGTA
jgi:Cu+-exporting ATPase